MRKVAAYLAVLFVLWALPERGMAQELEDSLLQVIAHASHDTTRANCYLELVEVVYFTDKEKGASYNEKAFAIATGQLKRTDLDPQVERTYKVVVGHAYTNRGFMANRRGEVESALQYYDDAVHIQEDVGDLVGVANTLSNLGYIYSNQDDTINALAYYHRALKIQLEIGDKGGQANSYNNVGAIYFKLGKLDSALISFQNSFANYEALNSKKGMAHAYNNIGQIMVSKGDFEVGLQYYLDCLKMREELDHKSGIANVTTNIASVYEDMGQIEKAREYGERSLKLSQELGFPFNIRNSAQLLSRIDTVQGRYEDALAHYQLYIVMRDSLSNEETRAAVERQNLRYEFEKEQAVAQAEYESVIALRDERDIRTNIVIAAAVGGLLLVLIFAVIIANRLKLTRQQKTIIEQQKQSVEGQKQQLEATHAELAERNREVVDSILYARRIQKAFLKNEERTGRHLPEHFILFKPKDIVSGDFYWAIEKQGYFYLAAADCTGHGVPGAFLTMLGTSLLNEIMTTKDLLSPAEVLDQLRVRIIKELGQTGADGDTKDGMDISMIRLHLETKALQWAGANNGLVLVNEEGWSEIKADKQPIGFHPAMQPFTNHEVSLQRGQSVYLYSDGFQDQFGGPRGKKYKSRRFKEQLQALFQSDMDAQKTWLDQEFESWRGDLEQVDDVCVIGVRL